MPKLTPEQKLQRRMSTYPDEMMQILSLAAQGKGYTKTFATHAQANAFLSRYYRFRMDVIESGNPTGFKLTALVATGTDANGARFDSKNRDAPGPITISWVWQGGFVEQIQTEAPPKPTSIPHDIEYAQRLAKGEGGMDKATEILLGVLGKLKDKPKDEDNG